MSGNNTDYKNGFNPAQILYEDNHLIVVNKLPSQIVQGDKTGDLPLSELVKEYLRIRYNKPGEAFLGVVHRLDRPVSGVTVFARTSKALSRLNNMIRDREVKKTYWAVVKNPPAVPEAHLVNYLARNEEKNKAYIVHEQRKGALRAELTYKIIGHSDHYYLLEINLLTGRHHQIRAQLAGIGCPIKGDLKYGYPRSNPDASIHLHARKIELMHPVRKEKLEIIAPVPDEPVWNCFIQAD